MKLHFCAKPCCSNMIHQLYGHVGYASIGYSQMIFVRLNHNGLIWTMSKKKMKEWCCSMHILLPNSTLLRSFKKIQINFHWNTVWTMISRECTKHTKLWQFFSIELFYNKPKPGFIDHRLIIYKQVWKLKKGRFYQSSPLVEVREIELYSQIQ